MAAVDGEHPLARAVVSAANERGEVPVASGFRSMTGRGVAAVVEGDNVAVGGPGLLRELGLDLPEGLTEQVGAWQDRGASVLFVVRAGRVVGR